MNEGGKEGGREAVGGWVNEGGIPTSSQISSTKRLKIAANLDPQSLFFRHLKQRDPENEVNTRGGGKNTWERGWIVTIKSNNWSKIVTSNSARA